MSARSIRRANGEGTVYPRQDGRWEGAAYVLTTDGVRKRKRVYGRTREEAHRKLTALIRQSHQGVPVAARSQTLAGYLDYWLEQVMKPAVRPRTYEGYEGHIRLHIKPGLGTKRLEKLTARDVRMFLNSKRDAGYSSRTVHHLHAILRNALQHAFREDLLTRNVAKQVRISVDHQEEIRPLSEPEARKLLSAARHDRLYALYAVALGLGLRRGEALGLRWEDIDLDEGVLRVGQTLQRSSGGLRLVPPKTPRSARSLPLPEVCRSALRGHRARQGQERLTAGKAWEEWGLVFTTARGTPLDPTDVSKGFARLCDQAGIRRIRLHDLRHTCATILLAQGVPPRVVMEILGHSTIHVTMNIYGHVVLDSQREAAQRMDGFLGA